MRLAELADICLFVSGPQTLTSDIFPAPCQNQSLVPHLKDTSHICLETEVQGYGMNFKVCNLGSKQPYFNSAYVVRVPRDWSKKTGKDQKLTTNKKSTIFELSS